MKKLIIIFLSILALFSCDQSPEFNYKPTYVLEAFLIVNEPIRNIKISKTLPLNQIYNFDSAIVKDAIITIFEGDFDSETKFELKLADPISQGFYYDNPNYTVKKSTLYSIIVDLNDGKQIRGQTYSPDSLSWVDSTRLAKVVQFPFDLNNVEDTPRFYWNYEGTFPLLSNNLILSCIDTINYGQYLEIPTDEMNSRIENEFREERDYQETREFIILSGETRSSPIVWSAFKFYGLHEITIYATDFNWTRWGIQYYRSEYNELLSSVQGDGIGCFGSASAIRDTFFVKKNKFY